ncbi:MAG: bifunctional folylpolyglutamate synthase/dihydrofolate synthase [Myxococcaceae bacterium]|nr:bifunctional folylpolyglutamate synthase/dihydrofolate synthase [Myxococcaceae bacterium]
MHNSPETFFESLNPFGMALGLTRMRHLLRALDNPHSALRVLQVAGTNGKGSAAATAAAILSAAGHRVGLYTSPHLVHLCERIRVDGADIDRAGLSAGVARLGEAMRKSGETPTYFEALTALAIDHFARGGVEIAVLEVGLGGRLDATSAVVPEVAIITRVGLDHTATLGPTLAAIAAEKAAILRPGTRAFIARQMPEALEVIARTASEQRCACSFAGRDFALAPEGGGLLETAPGQVENLPRGDVGGARASDGETPVFFEQRILAGRDENQRSEGPRTAPPRIGPLKLALAGEHQLDNAEVAIAAALSLSSRIEARHVADGLERVKWPGRFQIVDRRPLTIVDGAHNPDGARVLAAMCRARARGPRPRIVFSALADKDVASVARVILAEAASVHLVALDNPRAMRLGDLAALARQLGVDFTCHETVGAALEAARREALFDGPDGWALAAGSLYLVGAVLESHGPRGMA